MKKQFNLRAGIFILLMMLICNSGLWAQSGKAAAAGTAGTVSARSATKQKSALEELRTFKLDPSNNTSKLRYSLLESKAALEKGQSDNSLSGKQVFVLKQKIASIESELKNGTPNDEKSVMGGNVHAILREKQFSRSQFLSLTQQEQRQVLSHMNNLRVTDLVNASASNMRLRGENIYFITEDNFRNSDIMKQIFVLQNPANYIIVQDASMLPKKQISRAQFNSLPAERKDAIVASHDIEITE